MLSEKAQAGYFSAILQSKDIPEKFVPVLVGIFSRCCYNDDQKCMEIVSNTYVKKEIAKKLGMKSPSMINSGLAKFEEAKIVRCVYPGVYRMNPEFFGKRSWTEIQRIKIEHCFEKDITDINIIMEYADEQVILTYDAAFWESENIPEEMESQDEECNNPEDVIENESDPVEAVSVEMENGPSEFIAEDVEGNFADEVPSFEEMMPSYFSMEEFE